MTVIDRIVLKGRHIETPESLQRQALEQLHVSHMVNDKTKLLAYKSIYWMGMNNDIKNHIKLFYMSWIFSQHSPRKKIIHHEIPGKLWKVAGVDNVYPTKNYLYIVDYQSKCPVIKRVKNTSM